MIQGKGIAIYGGTFDPIHFAHLRTAIEAREKLGVEKVLLVPSYIPPHRAKPKTRVEERLQLLRLAVDSVEGLEIDTREINRTGTSYSIETLEELRSELGEQIPLYFIIGRDMYLSLQTWHRWQELTNFAHLVVLDRPGYASELVSEEVNKWAADKISSDIDENEPSTKGNIYHLKLRQMDISATMIREALKNNRAVDYLLPNSLIQFIQEHKLYQN